LVYIRENEVISSSYYKEIEIKRKVVRIYVGKIGSRVER